MQRLSLIIAFMSSGFVAHSQYHLTIDNKNPCPGQPVTFTLPSVPGCSNPRVANESDWHISPTPSRAEVHYGFSTINNVKGYTSVTLTYATYHSTINVWTTFVCDNKSTGGVNDFINMRPPLSSGPTISGLNGTLYSGDQSSVSASSAGAIRYSWQLSVVQTTSGSISQSAIASPSAQQTVINWPSNFVGVVKVIGTAVGCSESRQTIVQVSILAPPSVSFLESSVVSSHCAGTSMRYRLEVLGSFTITQTEVITTGGATNIAVVNTKNGVPVEWSIKWNSDGDIKIRYSLSNGSLTWSNKITPLLIFDVLEYDAGQIYVIPSPVYCAPANIVLSIDRKPTGSPYAFQYCNTGNCGINSSDWMNNSPSTSSSFVGISVGTSFRIKLTDNRCGTFQSTPVTIMVKPSPSVAVSDKFIFTDGTFDIPSSNQPFSTVDVKTMATGVSGAFDVLLQQGIGTGVLAKQQLTANGPCDGAVVYSITPSKDGCTGQTKTATVIVYKKPVVIADRPYVYKGRTTRLRTGSYDSYAWQTQSGEALGYSSTYDVSVPGNYKVNVNKNGAHATSDSIVIGSQFSDLNENYILTRQPLREFNSTTGLEDRSEHEVSENIQYFDGIGRPLQNISIRMSPLHHDVVQPFVYDHLGREARKYLPYVSSEDNGRIKENAIKEQSLFYQHPGTDIPFDADPYSQSIFEESPMNRVLKQGAVGTAWQPNASHPDLEHVIKHQYLLNTIADSVVRFGYDSEAERITWSYYVPGTLFMNKTIDEDKHDVIEFVDKLNRTVCKKVRAGDNIYACTYYVFDDLGNLVVVVPPEGIRAFLKL
ncbi:MAG: DUF6443 domain-containing protein [Bacteroidota bacterium]